jgi:cell division protein FtsZ
MIFGAVIDPEMGDEIRCTVIATGFERTSVPRRALERPVRNEKPAASAGSLFTSRPSESVSVSADYKTPSESKSASQPSISNDDLDIPTFLRNRR